MVSRLADEILWMVLAPSLTISDNDFESENMSTFGSNDNVSSSAILLVCKRWMRIATPLLYEVVVLRSTGQTHSLADTLKRNPRFGLYVKKIRLEAAFSRLMDVFKRCSNLQSLFFVLDDIRSSDSSHSLCRSLSVVNPTKVRLKDNEREGFDGDNANKRKIFLALCNSIPGWTKLRDFYFPYPLKLHGFGIAHPSVLNRRLLLAKALEDSPSVETIRSRTPREWDTIWSRLASNKRISFHFDVKPQEEDPLFLHFRNAINGNPELKGAINFEHKPSTSSLSGASLERSHDPLFSPLALTDSAISDIIWSHIFCFALFGDCPEDNDLADFMQQNLIRVVYPMFRRSNDISLVCRNWHCLIQRIFRHSPFVASVSGLERLADSLIHDPTVGSQIHVLSLDFGVREVGRFKERYHSALSVVFRGLPRLRYLFNFRASFLSWELFEALSITAGNTLVEILNLYVTPCPNRDETSEVFSHLRSLKKLEIYSLPPFRKCGTYAKDCIATIQELTFGVMVSSEPEDFAALHLPLLRTVRLCKAMRQELRFLESCGRSIRCLDVAVEPRTDSPEDGDVDLLVHCPNLETLILGSDFLFCPKFLGNSAGHNTLKEILISAWMGDQHYEPVSSRAMEHFFDKVNLTRFPHLTKIRFLQYGWPIRHRDIERAYLVKKSFELKQYLNVDIVDESGKTFRPRVERRRRN